MEDTSLHSDNSEMADDKHISLTQSLQQDTTGEGIPLQRLEQPTEQVTT